MNQIKTPEKSKKATASCDVEIVGVDHKIKKKKKKDGKVRH